MNAHTRQRGLSHKQIKNRRLKDQKPVVDAFLAWAEKVNPGNNSKLKKAINYVLNRRDILDTYIEDGRCSLSNNLSENSIRPVTVGRKNWLFSDTTDGAVANSKCLTMIEMAKAYNLDPYKYIEYILANRPSYDVSDDELEKLAPWSEDAKAICTSIKLLLTIKDMNLYLLTPLIYTFHLPNHLFLLHSICIV